MDINGGNHIPGVDLKLLGELLRRGRIGDATFLLFSKARAGIEPPDILTGGPEDVRVDEIIWNAVVKARAADGRDSSAERETISVGNTFLIVRERYLSAYHREFVRLQGGEDGKIHGTWSYFEKGKLQKRALRRDAVLLGNGKVTVVHSILRYVYRSRADKFQKREAAVAEVLRLETNGFSDEQTVKEAVKLAVPRVMTVFDDEVSASLKLLQRAMVGAIRKAEEEAGHED